MNEDHRRSEALAAKAASLSAEGRDEEARSVYAEAASSELAAFEAISKEKSRTRSILGVSLASLFYKAHEYDMAERQIFQLLASQEMSAWAEGELRELLEVVTDERMLQENLHRRYSGEVFTVALRGGEIGTGTGPLDLVLKKTDRVLSLLYRVAEYVGDFPFRVRGAPPKELVKRLQVRATQPSVGSYRLDIRLTESAQQDLFEEEPLRISDVTDTLFGFLETLTRGTTEAIEESIPDADYRRALLELVRQVAPAGRRLREVGLTRQREDRPQAVYLTAAVQDKVRQSLPQREKEPGSEIQELRGVLRALHLDENWLEITLEDGTHEKCDTVPEMLDDVLGPMVNSEVKVTGVQRRKQGGWVKLLVEEIELTEPD